MNDLKQKMAFTFILSVLLPVFFISNSAYAASCEFAKTTQELLDCSAYYGTKPSISPNTTSNTPVVCIPPPLDPAQLLKCNLGSGTAPGDVGGGGTDPKNPIALTLMGTSGIGGAFNSNNNTILIAAHSIINNDIGIYGVMLNGTTLVQTSSVFKIDQGPVNLWTGTPRVVYNPEQNKYLVVWEDERPAPNRLSIYGRFVSADGKPEGSDFHIVSGEFLNNLIYDNVNKKYVVTSSLNNPSIRILNLDGKISAQAKIVSTPGAYEAQASAAYNSNTNEYWLTYVTTLSGGDTPREDDRIMMIRLNATNLQKIGQPIQLSKTRIGRNAFADARIAYSPYNNAAMAAWLERGRNGEIAGIYGRTIYDNGSLSAEYPILTPTRLPYSNQYGAHTLAYNPWTQTFFISALDNNGGTMLTEIDVSGYVYNDAQVIAPDSGRGFNGNFNPTLVVTDQGGVVLSTRNYTNVRAGFEPSPNAIPPIPATPTTQPNPPGEVDTSTLSKMIAQIYIFSLAAGALLALLMIIFGGYLTMTAGGNAQQAQKGREFIVSSIVGLVLLMSTYLILSTINPDLVNLSLDSVKLLNR